MQDVSLVWGGDIVSDATGDVALASGTTLGQQRVLRRLLTNPGDYIWELTYGAGLARFVGMPGNLLAIKAAIRAQIFKEPAVSRLPEPSIDVQAEMMGAFLCRFDMWIR